MIRGQLGHKKNSATKRRSYLAVFTGSDVSDLLLVFVVVTHTSIRLQSGLVWLNRRNWRHRKRRTIHNLRSSHAEGTVKYGGGVGPYLDAGDFVVEVQIGCDLRTREPVPTHHLLCTTQVLTLIYSNDLPIKMCEGYLDHWVIITSDNVDEVIIV